MQRNLIALLLLLVIGGAATFLLLNRGGGDPTGQNQNGPAVTQNDPVPVDTKPTQNLEVSKVDETKTHREEIKPVDLGPGAGAAQGVKGRIVDDRGSPVQGATVWLMPSPTQDIFSQMLAKQRGVVYRPIASATSDQMGAFAVGLVRIEENPAAQLRIVAPGMCEGRVPNLKLAPGEWHDTGAIKLDRGVVLAGVVRHAGTGAPVTGAEITLKQQALGMDLAAIPGRENGITVKADATGAYKFEDAPIGAVSLIAVAPGCARLERSGVMLNREAQNTQDFELSPGRAISGGVVTADGAPVPSAVVSAIAISSKTPMTVETRTGRDGRFEILGLVEGLYQLSAVAEGYSKTPPKPVDAGETEAVLTLEKLGMVQVQVYGKNGRLLSDYHLTVRTAAPGQELFGNTTIPPKHVRNPREGIATVEGLDPNTYVLQVDAAGHARAFSERFTIAVGQNPAMLAVRMTEGGVIAGVVYNKDGAPLAGAAVATLAGDLDESPISAIFGGLVPVNITKTSVTTDAKGAFRIALLNEGKYHVKVSHPEHFDVRFPDVEVKTGEVVNLPDVRMASGTVVLGTVRVDGVPAGQIKVAVSGVPDPTKPATPFHAEAQTGSDGRFTVGRRLPPGRYSIVASRQTAENPFVQFMDYSKTKQEFEVSGAQSQFIVDLQISSK